MEIDQEVVGSVSREPWRHFFENDSFLGLKRQASVKITPAANAIIPDVVVVSKPISGESVKAEM